MPFQAKVSDWVKTPSSTVFDLVMPTFVGLANWQIVARRHALEIGDAKLIMLAQNTQLPGITEIMQENRLHPTADGLSQDFAAARQRMVVGKLRELSRRIG